MVAKISICERGPERSKDAKIVLNDLQIFFACGAMKQKIFPLAKELKPLRDEICAIVWY